MADARLTQPRDLIGDIHAQQRRKLFRRVALGVALFVILLLVAVALKFLADRRHRDACLTDASQGFSLGTSAELVTVATKLESCITAHPNDPLLRGSLALTRAQLLAEFGESDQEAHDAVAALAELEFPTHDGELASVMLDLDDDKLDAAHDRLATIGSMDGARSIAPNHEVWVSGMLAIADPEANLDEAIDTITATLPDDGSISIRRLLATLHMHAGDSSAALAQLVDARSRSQTHLGLAADEALYNALLRQKLAGVADVADQLLGGGFELAQRDRAHALLARGVVRVQSGEIEAGMKLVDEAWVMLPGWDKLSRTLALEMAMEAGDGERARRWIDEAGLRASESEIYEAWVKLVEGDVMSALEELAKLPQEHPRVALLQGLALVEQNRFAEAQAWLDRADKLIPGRVDVEVARARVEVHTGDPEAARRKLDALTREEPFAPRAWTGLGEANLGVAYRSEADDGSAPRQPDAAALRDARRAFKKAVELERTPADAYLHLAELTDIKRRQDPTLVPEVLDLYAKAVAANPKLPRYAEREALYLVELNFRTQAISKLEAVLDRPGTSAEVPLALANLALLQIEFGDRAELPAEFDGWLEQAKERGGVPARTLELLAGRALLVRGQPQEALAKLEPLVAADEAYTDARLSIVHAHMDLRDRDTALAQVKRGLAALPDELKGPLLYEWANVMSRGGKRRPAANFANNGWKKLSVHPDSSVADLLFFAQQAIYLLNRDKQPKPAAIIGREITELVPFHSDAWVVRADAEIRTNRGSDAKASAEKAVELDDDNPRAHEVLAQVWLRFGYKDRAKASFERALELAKDTPREKEIKKSRASLGG